MQVFAVPTLLVAGSLNATADDLGEAMSTWPGFFTEPDRYWGDFLWVLGVALIPLVILAAIGAKVLRRQTPQRPRRTK